MKTFLFILSFISVLSASAQIATADIDDFYPKTGDVKAKSESKYSIVQAAGCVSGDCRNGEGIYLFATSCIRKIKSAVGDYTDSFKIRRYKGRFSNDGANFEGSVAGQQIPYGLKLGKNSLKFEPEIKTDLRDENTWQHMLTGSMSRVNAEKPFYKVQGWRPPVEFTDAVAGTPRRVHIYFEGYPSYARIEYAPGGLVKSFSGKIAATGDPVCGRFLYTDGSSYEGFVYHGKYFGPGRFKDTKGAVQEGIWKMDTLLQQMAFTFPAAMMEPRPESEEQKSDYFIYSYKYIKTKFRHFAAGKDWAFAYDSINIIYGEVKDNGYNGTGTWFSCYAEPGSSSLSYRVGKLKQGTVVEGFRIKDYLSCNRLSNSWGAFHQCELTSSALSQGSYGYDQLEGCATNIIYDSEGRPKEIQEGHFEGHGKGFDTPTGWVYINDWAGLRSKEKLQFYYQGTNIKATNNANDYGYAAYYLQKNQYCFPSMQLQGKDVTGWIFNKLDSMNTVYYKNKAITDAELLKKKQELDLEKKERNEKFSACAAELKKYDKPIGSTLTSVSNGFTGILQEVDCEKWLMTIVVPGGRSSINGARSSKTVSLNDLAFWQRTSRQYHLCKKCNGMGGESVTTVTSKTKELPFGYFSGIETKVTHTKTQTSWVSCIYCNGGGVVLE